MTRQQKKILKKINEIERYIEADRALGKKPVSSEFYEPVSEKLESLQKQLVYLECDDETEKDRRSTAIRNLARRGALLLYDVIVVNLSYFMAVILRFMDADSYSEQGIKFMQMYKGFAPWYTLMCVVLFLLFRMYRGVWRYAGFNDLRKLVSVNLCTSIMYICGSLFVVGRMPLSVYFVGAVIQFALMCVPRLLPRYVVEGLLNRRSDAFSEGFVPLMIVGKADSTRLIREQIRKNKDDNLKPVCVVDTDGAYNGGTFDGLPVYTDPYGIYKCIEKYGVRCVIFADKDIPGNLSDYIRKICDGKNIEIRNNNWADD